MTATAPPTAVVFCAGRGSYGRAELGTIARLLDPDGDVAAALDVADAERTAAGLPAVRELDAAASFRPGLHLQGRNAADLIWFATMAHVERLRARYRIAAVCGNSLGWYTALAAAGMLRATDGWRLVHTMARLQELARGGQVLTTTVDDAWQPDGEARAELGRALEEVQSLGDEHFVAPSIWLGGHEVVAGTEAGVQRLLATLRERKVGDRTFPFRLAGHGPFHTPLCTEVAARAEPELMALPTLQPTTFLIDGRGNVHSPWSADPRALLRYTATTQVTETFDFTAAVRTALREFNPDVLLCPAPGTSLRAPIGHVVLREGWRGIGDKQALFASGVIRVD